MKHLRGYHLRPWKNWCNDPNGLIYFEGKYHAFYQHYPDKPVWGPMHWGHAVSEDTYAWKHKPIAIFPDKNGYAFSGSAIHDTKNVTGLGEKEGDKPLLLFYTSHKILDPENPDDYTEDQSIAYSNDGVTFKPYDNNPVLKNRGTKDFRDPKLFYHEETERWIMCLAVFDRIEFFSSTNLLDWSFLSSFTSDYPSAQGLWECSDLFKLENEGESAWILIVSYGLPVEEGRSVTRYFIGDFDGKKFISNSIAYDFDFGPDYYAGVTIANCEPTTTIGWAMNWGYADSVPTEGYRGQMSGAREHFLFRDKAKALRLGSRPVDLPDKYIASIKKLEAHATIDGPVMVEVEASTDFTLEFSNEHDERVVIRRDKDSYSVDRSESGDMRYHPMLKDGLYRRRIAPLLKQEPGSSIVFLDGPVLEIYAEDGTLTFTFLVYPSKPYNKVSIQGTTAELRQLQASEQIPTVDPYLNQEAYR